MKPGTTAAALRAKLAVAYRILRLQERDGVPRPHAATRRQRR